MVLILPFLFAVWAVADLISYAFTGEDTVQHLADFLGWTQTVGGSDTITLQWGTSFMDFLINNAMYIIAATAVILVTLWISMRPFDSNGKIIWGIVRAHKVRKERRLRGARSL